MSESDIQRLWAAISGLQQTVTRLTVLVENQAGVISEMRADVRVMASQGCAKYVIHAATEEAIKEHGKSIRELQDGKNWLAGVIAVVSALIGGVVSAVGGLLLKKIGG